MIKESKDNCWACKYYKEINEAIGACRLDPPKTFMNKREESKKPSFINEHPRVRPNDWCGKFESI